MSTISIEDAVAVFVASGGQSWKWQLRDKNGRWIRMNSTVQWTERGQQRRGTVVGSPKEGQATVRDESGKEHTLPASALSLASGSNATKPAAKARTGKTSSKVPPLPPLSATAKKNLRDVGDLIRDDVPKKDQAEAVEAAQDIIVGHVAKGVLEKAKDSRVTKLLKPLVDKGKDAAIRLHILFLTSEKAQSATEKLTVVGEELLGAHTGQMRAIGIGDFTTAIGLGNPFYDPVDFAARIAQRVGPVLKFAGQLIASGMDEDDAGWRLRRTRSGQWYVTVGRIPVGLMGIDRDEITLAALALRQEFQQRSIDPTSLSIREFAQLAGSDLAAMTAAAMQTARA